MICSQCGNEWHANKSICPQCGFIVHMSTLPEQEAFPDAIRFQAAYAEDAVNMQQKKWMPGIETRGGAKSPSGGQSGTLPPQERFSGEPDVHSDNAPSLQPGMRLRHGRYSLQERLGQQRWLSGVSETHWTGRDFQYKGEAVVICEVVLPDAHSLAMKTMLRAATHSLVAVGNNPGISTLKDVFDDQGRIFFVFESSKGESLPVRLRRLGRPLPEQEAIAFCVQISEVLELLARQTPPLVHGFISPEHIYFSYNSSQYMLGGISPIIASGVAQLTREITSARSLPYTAPEFAQGIIDGQSDLYSLLATTYYAVTGTVPAASRGGIPPAQHVNAAISSAFNAILAKGLYPAPHQRYQHPFDLLQDLRAIRSRAASGSLVGHTSANVSAPPFMSREKAVPFFGSDVATLGSSYPLPIRPPILDEDEEHLLLPSPETLPQMREGNERLEAVVTLTLVLLGFGVATALGSLHV